MKTLFNDKKKAPITPPLLKKNKLVSDFKAKANYFNNFFPSKCTPVVHNSNITELITCSSEARLSQISFNDNCILK